MRKDSRRAAPKKHEWQSKAESFDYRQMAADLEEDMKVIRKRLDALRATLPPGALILERRADVQSLQTQYLEMQLRHKDFLRRAAEREKEKKHE